MTWRDVHRDAQWPSPGSSEPRRHPQLAHPAGHADRPVRSCRPPARQAMPAKGKPGARGSPMARLRRPRYRAPSASGGWFDPWAIPGGVDPTGLVKGWAVEQALVGRPARGWDGGRHGQRRRRHRCLRSASTRPGLARPASAIRGTPPRSLPSGSYGKRGGHLVNPFTGQARPAAPRPRPSSVRASRSLTRSRPRSRRAVTRHSQYRGSARPLRRLSRPAGGEGQLWQKHRAFAS